MNCNHCGAPLAGDAKFCSNCGAPVQQPPAAPYSPAYDVEPQVGFLEAVILYFTRYTDFSTRSRRSEYWWVFLFHILFSVAATTIFGRASELITTLFSLVTFIPGLAIAVRRLHDVGKSGFWVFWALLPIAGPIILLVQYLKDSGPDNQWGPDPKKLH